MKMIRSLAKRLPHPVLCRLYHQVRLREELSRIEKIGALTGLPLLKDLNLLSLRKSDTLFVLGSGWSINDIPDARWKSIGRSDSVGVNFWLAHPFVPRFFHYENVVHDDQPIMYSALKLLLERKSEDYLGTVKIVTEVNKIGPLQTVFDLPNGMRKDLYVGFSMPVVARNEEELRSGIRYMRSIGAFSPRSEVAWLFKYGGSVVAMMALAVIMGYKRVVLCGVDLKKQNYFYQHPELYPEFADWEFVSRRAEHLTTRSLPWLVPAQSAVYAFKDLVLGPQEIELFVESSVSSLYPRVPVAPNWLFNDSDR